LSGFVLLVMPTYLRDAPDASQEDEGACADLGHELLEHRRVDLVLERCDEQRLAGRGS